MVWASRSPAPIARAVVDSWVRAIVSTSPARAVTRTISAFVGSGNAPAAQTVALKGAAGIRAPCPVVRVRVEPEVAGAGAVTTVPIARFASASAMGSGYAPGPDHMQLCPSGQGQQRVVVDHDGHARCGLGACLDHGRELAQDGGPASDPRGHHVLVIEKRRRPDQHALSRTDYQRRQYFPVGLSVVASTGHRPPEQRHQTTSVIRAEPSAVAQTPVIGPT